MRPGILLQVRQGAALALHLQDVGHVSGVPGGLAGGQHRHGAGWGRRFSVPAAAHPCVCTLCDQSRLNRQHLTLPATLRPPPRAAPQVAGEDRGRQRDAQLADGQHQAVPQVQQACGEEWWLQPRGLQLRPGACGRAPRGFEAAKGSLARGFEGGTAGVPWQLRPPLLAGHPAPLLTTPPRPAGPLTRQAFCWLCGQGTGMQHTWSSIANHSCGRFKVRRRGMRRA